MTVPFYEVSALGRTSVVFLAGTGVKTVPETHPMFNKILAALKAGEDNVERHLDVVNSTLKAITDRVSWNGKNVLWDGDPVHSVLSDQLERFVRSGEENYLPLAKFWEKLESNPNQRSREQAYEWLASNEFKITESGDVVAYKGVTSEGLSSFAGSAYIDGVLRKGYIQYVDGTVVTMPRSQVSDDPYTACHHGLHVATWNFARNFSHKTKMVYVNPRDIVSVPNAASKMRVCRLEVVCDVAEAAVGGEVLTTVAV